MNPQSRHFRLTRILFTRCFPRQLNTWSNLEYSMIPSQIARFMWPTWGPPGTDRTQMGPMWATWTLLSGMLFVWSPKYLSPTSLLPLHVESLDFMTLVLWAIGFIPQKLKKWRTAYEKGETLILSLSIALEICGTWSNFLRDITKACFYIKYRRLKSLFSV